MTDIPKLRGHHLICFHFFSGKGYNREFVENLRNTLEKIAEFGVEVSHGADDVCSRCPHLKGGICSYSDHSHDEIMEMDKFALRLLKETSGSKAKWHVIKQRIPEIFPLWLGKYCKKCLWEDVCEEDFLYRKLKYGKDPV